MDEFKSYNDKFGYNICPKAGSCFGIKHSENLEKMSKVRLGKKISTETIKKCLRIIREK